MLNRVFYCLIDWLTLLANKQNSGGTGLICSLFNVTSSCDVPFHQPHQLQCDSTYAYLCSPLWPFLSLQLQRWWFAVLTSWLQYGTKWLHPGGCNASRSTSYTWNAQHIENCWCHSKMKYPLVAYQQLWRTPRWANFLYFL